MNIPLVACHNLVKIYAVRDAGVEVVALQGLDLDVAGGEMLAILGQSGSGKTTLLNILGGLDLPSAGRCVVAGYDLTHMNEAAHDQYRRHVVGHMWQQGGRNLLPGLTVAGNVRLPQALAGVGGVRRARRAEELLRLVGLSGMGRRRLTELSGGEQQRAAIAVALANQPALLLADEPTGELDSATAREIIGLLRAINQQVGLTVILVTHDAAVASVMDRTVTIRDGRSSSETVRRDASPSSLGERGGSGQQAWGAGSEVRGDVVIIDSAGWLQLPEEAHERIAPHGRAEVRVARDHAELWPVGVLDAAASDVGLSDLPLETHRAVVLIDRVGRMQLPALVTQTVPFQGRAAVAIARDHVELWPRGARGLSTTRDSASPSPHA